jgi:hypothetical protein
MDDQRFGMGWDGDGIPIVGSGGTDGCHIANRSMVNPNFRLTHANREGMGWGWVWNGMGWVGDGMGWVRPIHPIPPDVFQYGFVDFWGWDSQEPNSSIP